VVFGELKSTGHWLKANPGEAAKILGPLWGNLDAATVQAANDRRSYEVQSVKADKLNEQQSIADAFFAAGLLPKAVNAKDVEIWQP
jgi:sulfonate transport system substrate-binding protein